MVSPLMGGPQINYLQTLAQIYVNSNEYNHTTTEKTENDLIHDIRPKIRVRVPFLGKQGEFLVKKLLKKIQRNLTQAVKISCNL